MKDTYDELLKNAPAQDSSDFIDYLRRNNEVVSESFNWLLIKNAKREGWITAFFKSGFALMDLEDSVFDPYLHLEWRKHKKEDQSVPGRFHIHLMP